MRHTGTQTAWDMLQEEQESLARITTSCADLDNILGGGIGCREVTEIGLLSLLSHWANFFVLCPVGASNIKALF